MSNTSFIFGYGERAYFYGITFEPGDNIEVEIVKIPSNDVVMPQTVMAL